MTSKNGHTLSQLKAKSLTQKNAISPTEIVGKKPPLAQSLHVLQYWRNLNPMETGDFSHSPGSQCVDDDGGDLEWVFYYYSNNHT